MLKETNNLAIIITISFPPLLFLYIIKSSGSYGLVKYEIIILKEYNPVVNKVPKKSYKQHFFKPPFWYLNPTNTGKVP